MLRDPRLRSKEGERLRLKLKPKEGMACIVSCLSEVV